MQRYTLGTPVWSKELFVVENAETLDCNVTFTCDSWHGRMATCRGIGASSLSEEAIEQFKREHIEYMSSQPEKFDILHYVTILNMKKK